MYGTSVSCTKFSIHDYSANPFNLSRDINCTAHPFFSYWRIQFCALQWFFGSTSNRYASFHFSRSVVSAHHFPWGAPRYSVPNDHGHPWASHSNLSCHAILGFDNAFPILDQPESPIWTCAYSAEP